MRGCSLSPSGRSRLYFKGQGWGGKCEMLVELVEGFLYSMDIPWGSPKLFLYPGNYEFGPPHHFLRYLLLYSFFTPTWDWLVLIWIQRSAWFACHPLGVPLLNAWKVTQHQRSFSHRCESTRRLIELTIASVLLKFSPEVGRLEGVLVNTVGFLLAPAPSSLLIEMFNWSLLSRTFPSAYKRNDCSSLWFYLKKLIAPVFSDSRHT